MGRRSSHARQSTGKRVHLTDRDQIWLEKLAAHGPLPTSYLLAFTAALRHSQKRDQERLGDLFHEINTKHGGAYLDRPPQQFATLKAGYNQLVHAVSDIGMRAISDQSPKHPRKAVSGPWLHQHIVACVTASIELAALRRSDLSYIPEHEILSRAGRDLRWPVPTTDPQTGRTLTKDLIPDGIFGLTYHGTGGNKYRFFIIEADRGTEPATSRNWNRKSFERHLAQYDGYVAGGLYRDHLKLTAPLLVLNIVPDESRLQLMLRQTERHVGACSYQLFQSFPDFAAPWRPPHPNHALLESAWVRSGMPEFRIDFA